jgi:chemotaxis protein CheZ
MTDELKALRAQADVKAKARDEDGTQDLKAELAHVTATIARTKRELAGLIGDHKERPTERPMTRAAAELGAAVDGMETATQKILKSAESADDGARALAASLKTDYERGLAQDIQDHILHIFEACNFQDLAGQRIANVIATLNAIEQRVSGMIEHFDGATLAPAAPARIGNGRGLINGPRLDGDAGHASQREIDKLFS